LGEEGNTNLNRLTRHARRLRQWGKLQTAPGTGKRSKLPSYDERAST
jgi:hypothetical protein